MSDIRSNGWEAKKTFRKEELWLIYEPRVAARHVAGAPFTGVVLVRVIWILTVDQPFYRHGDLLNPFWETQAFVELVLGALGRRILKYYFDVYLLGVTVGVWEKGFCSLKLIGRPSGVLRKYSDLELCVWGEGC